MTDRVFEWADGKEHYDHPNISYDAEACGLTLVADLADPNASYSFDDVMAFRDTATGGIYLAHDSGCSCPTPFEDYTKLSDLTRIESVEAAQQFVAGLNNYQTWPLRDVFAFIEKVEAALRGAPPETPT